uniref:Carbohydrate sulfotransferase n=2 Tax=Caenorhabditis japonica TaxID=281687 RepID=A0A8R1DFM7_CAEJA
KLPKRAKNISAQTLCAQKLACAPQFRKYETMLRVSPKYKMVNCVVQKSMSTMMTGAMCYLYDEMEYENTGRSFDDEFNGRLCKSQNEFSSVNDVRNKYNISLRQTGWSFSMVVRHPIDRFVSGYVDRCVRLLVMNATAQCNGCRLNMTCFIENEYKRLMQISYKRKTRRTMEDAHFFPQVWHCDLPDEREFFEFLPYSTDSEEEFMPHFEDLLQRQDVPESSIQFIRDQFLTRIPSHATTGTAAKRFYYNRLMNSPYLLEFIVKMFYWDFIQFHYAFPPGFEQ